MGQIVPSVSIKGPHIIKVIQLHQTGCYYAFCDIFYWKQIKFIKLTDIIINVMSNDIQIFVNHWIVVIIVTWLWSICGSREHLWVRRKVIYRGVKLSTVPIQILLIQWISGCQIIAQNMLEIYIFSFKWILILSS